MRQKSLRSNERRERERELPSNVKCVAEKDGAHESSNSNPQRLKHDHKDRPFLINAPSEHRIGHRTPKNSLQNIAYQIISTLIV